jgi:hypothetical protein
MPFRRAIVEELAVALQRKPPLLHVIVGPRQVGKTTAAQQLAEKLGWPTVFAAADAPLPPGPDWLETQWRLARLQKPGRAGKVLLVLDEVQKIAGWSETVKRLWDEERRTKGPVLAVLLGSSALLVHKGASESLAGRFFLHPCQHWSFDECRQAFGWDLDQWLFFGGYPGAAALADDEAAWKRHVADSLIDVVLSRDVVALQTITKPALLRHLFALAASYPAQMLSYNKMLGQLQDAGNTTTLAGYLRLLETAFMVSGLELFSQGHIRKRGSSPKLILWNNALINALSLRSRRDTTTDGGFWGRLIENAVGAHLLTGLAPTEFGVTYWRDGVEEVDFVVTHGKRIWAIEVKSGRPGRLAGLAKFMRRYPKAQPWLVGGGGIPLAEFFCRPATDWFR